MAQPQQLLAILFADIAGSTQLYEQVGDVEAHRQVALSLQQMATAVEQHSGKVLRTVGDSTLASFSSCDNALSAAATMQESHKAMQLSVRVGFHFGQVIPDKGDVYGNAVNIAARVASFAKSDEITATADSIARLSPENQARATLLDTISVKGISEPMGIYRFTWEADANMHTRIASSPMPAATPNPKTKLPLLFQGKSFTIDDKSSSLSVGRDLTSNLSVDGERVSRKHAHIDWSAGQLLLTDTSTNGTFIQREGESPLFVRRETVVLDGTGSIGFGCLPSEEVALAAHYSLDSDRS